MVANKQLPEEIVARIQQDRILGIRAGSDGKHREMMKEKVSAASREKYNTPGSVGYVAEMSRSPSRDTTMELIAV